MSKHISKTLLYDLLDNISFNLILNMVINLQKVWISLKRISFQIVINFCWLFTWWDQLERMIGRVQWPSAPSRGHPQPSKQSLLEPIWNFFIRIVKQKLHHYSSIKKVKTEDARESQTKQETLPLSHAYVWFVKHAIKLLCQMSGSLSVLLFTRLIR